MLFFDAKKYGIATENADLWINSARENETKIRMGAPVEILEHSRDGKVLYVKTEDYEGYVNGGEIGRCSRKRLEKYCRSDAFVVARRYFFCQGKFIRMGSRFPLIREEAEHDVCLLPARRFGRFGTRRCRINRKYLHSGYMRCTPKNILELAASAEGIPYGFGDREEGMDCSSYVGGIFRCFGIYLPRNVAQMLELPYPAQDVDGMGEQPLVQALEKMGEGCLLFTRHHVMIYAGQREGQARFWHCSNRMGGKCLQSGFGPYLQESVKIMKIR